MKNFEYRHLTEEEVALKSLLEGDLFLERKISEVVLPGDALW